MFAVGALQGRSEVTDLSVNVPPKVIADRLLSATMNEVAERIDADAFGAFPPVEGEYSHRATVAAWMSEERVKVGADELILCSGARHALAVAFGVACGSNGLVLTEDLPYPEAAHMCRAANFRLEGITMDAEGMDPEALECRLGREQSKVARRTVYVTLPLSLRLRRSE
jgi:DNA-binding transcriptional MocR family regulator